MELNRRNFLKITASGATITALGGISSVACSAQANNDRQKNNSVELKISFQEGTAPGENLNAKLDYMENLGITGFEPGGRGLAGRVKEFKEALKGHGLTRDLFDQFERFL